MVRKVVPPQEKGGHLEALLTHRVRRRVWVNDGLAGLERGF